jgi:nicotinamidase-related amidase
MNKTHSLPIPSHFDRTKVGAIWRVEYQNRAEEAEAWAGRHGIGPASNDEKQICLLLVDCQNTFCIPGFELFVAGRSGHAAVDDNVRLCEFVYRNMGDITSIHPTMDTHKAMQIFHPIFLIDADGRHPAPMTEISVADVETGRWRVNPSVADNVEGRSYERLQAHLLHYCRRLDESGKFSLMIWPYHAMLGGIGHALVPAVEEALFFLNVARRSQTRFEVKGDNPLTEHYSVLSPEVVEDADEIPIAHKNEALIGTLLRYDAVIIAGQAKSHCVAWTVEDLIAEALMRGRELVKRIYLLEDCTSPVVTGPVDFTERASEAFRRFAEMGVHIVRSTDPIRSWPGIDH